MASRAREIVFRRLWEFDRSRYAAHLRRLNARDRRDRFMGEMDPKAIAKHAAAVDWSRTAMLGCFVDGTLRGVAELHLGGGARPDHAELAFSVERGFQGRGSATELMRRMLTTARNRALKRVILICLMENARIRRVAAKFGSSMAVDSGEATAELRLLPPTPSTFLAEAWADADDLFGRGLELSRAIGRKLAAPERLLEPLMGLRRAA